MIWPACQGVERYPPCLTCYGSGIAYCCEGDRCDESCPKETRGEQPPGRYRKTRLAGDGAAPSDFGIML
jgi:hypothetical protein